MVSNSIKTQYQIKRLVEAAAERIGENIIHTPLRKSVLLSQFYDAEIYLKLENIQLTGSFKIRGAYNKLLQLTDAEKRRGVITFSTGNHAVGFASACQYLGISGHVVMPAHVPKVKQDNLSAFSNIQLVLKGRGTRQAELCAQELAEKNGWVFVSPYSDYDIIAGQGTVGLEIQKALPDFDRIYLAVGGGGLVTGVGSYLKNYQPNLEIIGCQPAINPVMSRSVSAGKIVSHETRPSFSDGTGGNINPETITFPYCCDLVDRYLLASEEEILLAMAKLMRQEHLLVEGAAALSLACMHKEAEEIKGKKIVLVLCGANVGISTLKAMLSIALPA